MALTAHFILVLAATGCAAAGCWIPVAILAAVVLALIFRREISGLLGSLAERISGSATHSH